MRRPYIVDIGIDDTIPYVALDPTPGGSNLGRAAFAFCPIWKNGRMASLLIFPKQQRVDVRCYRLTLRVKNVGHLNTFSFHGRADAKPHCWRMSWCEEHGTVSYEVYVPSNTNALSFMPHFGNTLDIHFGAANDE